MPWWLHRLVGVIIGYLAAKLTQRVSDPMIEVTLTTIAAYGSFILAEQFHLSGIIATVAAAMLCSSDGARTGMSPSMRIAVESFWEYVAFALNSIVFLLIGFAVRVSVLLRSWQAILVAYLAVSSGRAVLIYLATLFLRRTLTFGVVILSILLQGLSMEALLRKLKLAGTGAERLAYERERGMMLAKTAALAALEQLLPVAFCQTVAKMLVGDRGPPQVSRL